MENIKHQLKTRRFKVTLPESLGSRTDIHRHMFEWITPPDKGWHNQLSAPVKRNFSLATLQQCLSITARQRLEGLKAFQDCWTVKLSYSDLTATL